MKQTLRSLGVSAAVMACAVAYCNVNLREADRRSDARHDRSQAHRDLLEAREGVLDGGVRSNTRLLADLRRRVEALEAAAGAERRPRN